MSRVLAIDFDGTLVTHRFPQIGIDAPEAVETILDLQKNYKFKVILFTMRDDGHFYNPESGKCEKLSEAYKALGYKSTLQDAIDWCTTKGITLYGVNKNPSQFWSASRKVYANMYIDDTGCGIPMTTLSNGEICVDWPSVREIIFEKMEKGEL